MRIRKNINDIGWKFGKNCSSIPSAYPVDWEDVTLPHTWNALDGQDGGNETAVGTAVLHKTVPSHESHLPGQLSAEEIAVGNAN